LTEVGSSIFIFKGESAYYFENRYISKSGKIIWFAWFQAALFLRAIDILLLAKELSTEKKKLEVSIEQVKQAFPA